MWYWIAGGAIALASGYAIYRNWRKIVSLLKGKKIAVLGAQGVGKTHLITFLTSGVITEEYIQTLAPTSVQGRKFDLRELSLKFRETIDVPGGQVAYAVWKDLFDDADLVFYLFRVDKIKSGDPETIRRIQQDTRQIRQWIDEKKRDHPTVIAIGTFCDFDPDYRSLTLSTKGNYQESFMRLDVIRQVVRNINAEWWVLGSMENIINTEDLAYRLFNTIKALRK